jgi:hypothetical protein
MDRPEPQAQDDYSRGVNLVTLIANEFGTARSIARLQLMLGETLIDGEPYQNSDKLFAPYELVKDKEITVIGPDRRWKFRFDG